MVDVAAVVVTFNRKMLLVECLEGLLQQTRPVSKIYIIDNASTDGTRHLLAEQQLLAHPIVTYVQLASNGGGAAGFHEGLKIARDAGHEWIWLMDDDAEPRPDALEQLSAHFSTVGVSVLAPVVVDGQGGFDAGLKHRKTATTNRRFTNRRIGTNISEAMAKGQRDFEIEYFSFVGPCVAGWAVAKAGLPLKELFIYHDDIEYSERMRQVGRVLCIPQSQIMHKEVRRDEKTRRSDSRLERASLGTQWSKFFNHRNMIYLSARKRVRARLIPQLLHHASILGGILMHDSHKWDRLRFWNAALFDGLSGNLDNEKPRRLIQEEAARQR